MNSRDYYNSGSRRCVTFPLVPKKAFTQLVSYKLHCYSKLINKLQTKVVPVTKPQHILLYSSIKTPSFKNVEYGVKCECDECFTFRYVEFLISKVEGLFLRKGH